ncbi:hypothetical protein RP20_CCG001615 [Aedes albopictus]|nr:hypothetical protein RP20_CCG001615 [Aedes albopictus]
MYYIRSTRSSVDSNVRTVSNRTMNRGRQLALIIVCLGSSCLAARNDHWRNLDEQSDLLENLESLKEAQEALLKLSIYSATKGRQYSDDSNLTINMSKEKFENMVSKINSEVSLLRNQALILSQAYKELMVKHKLSLKKIDMLHVNKPSTVPEKSPNPDSTNPPPVTISNSVQLPKPVPECNCNCIQQPSGPYVIGNKYYYYNVFATEDNLSNLPRPPWKPQPPSPSAPAYHHPPPAHHLNQRPSRPDWDDPDALPSHKLRPGATSSKFSLLQDHTEPYTTPSWKKKYFDQHDLETVEKLFSDSEAQALTEQWARKNERRKASKMGPFDH